MTNGLLNIENKWQLDYWTSRTNDKWITEHREQMTNGLQNIENKWQMDYWTSRTNDKWITGQREQMTNGLLNIENKWQMDYWTSRTNDKWIIVSFFLKPSHLTPDDVGIFTIIYVLFANRQALPPPPPTPSAKEDVTHIRQITWLFLQSSDSGPPPPSPSGECVPYPFGSRGGGGTQSLTEEGVGDPNPDEGTGTVVL